MQEKEFENPEPRAGEKLEEFIPRCISYIMTKEGKSRKEATGKCYGLYEYYKGNNMSEEQTFTCSADIEINTDDKGNKIYTMIAAIGDRFMAGGFLPNDVLEQSTQYWNNTLHDINHMGFNPMQLDIRYFIGYHINARYDKDNKALIVDIVVKPDMPYTSAWESYISLCKEAGIKPNVSVTYSGTTKRTKVSTLPVDYKNLGFKENDYVPYLNTITPLAISTVVKGRCSDKDGCGIQLSDTCKDGTCELQEEKRKELINFLKEHKLEGKSYD